MSNKEEELVTNGDEAEVVLQAPAFNNTVNKLVESCFQSFVNSKAEEAEAREKTYHHYRALVDIVETLKQSVSVRNEIQSKNKTDNQEEEGTDH